MDALSYEESKLIPLRFGEQVMERIADLVGTALRTNLWLILLDAERVQLQQVIELDRSGIRGADLTTGVAHMFEALASCEDVTAVVTVLERPGAEEFTPDDREWARAIHAACTATHLDLAGVLVSHSSGVRWLAEDDYLVR